MLDFVQKLYVRMPPNTTSWCETVEEFLDQRGFKLTTRVCVLALSKYITLLIVLPAGYITTSVWQCTAMVS